MKFHFGILFLLCLARGVVGSWFDGGDDDDDKPTTGQPPSPPNQTPGSDPRPNLACNNIYTLPNTCQNFARASVNGINTQIRKELNASYTYMSLGAYFGRDDISYRGAAKFFMKSSEEEREHGMKFIEYLNKRGGKPHFKALHPPATEWGTLLQAFETALELEKAVNDNLLTLHWEAQEKNDPHLQDFIEGEFLTEQVESIKQLSDFITILRRTQSSPVGWHMFDEELYEGKR